MYWITNYYRLIRGWLVIRKLEYITTIDLIFKLYEEHIRKHNTIEV